MLGAGLDLHRGKLPKSAIEAATAEMLVMLGLQRTAAQQASAIRIRFETPAPLPLQWLALVSGQGTTP